VTASETKAASGQAPDGRVAGTGQAGGRPLIKICGLSAAPQARLAAELGADLCGFIFHPPSPRNADPRLVRDFPTPGALRVGVFVGQGAEQILETMEAARLDLAQLHGPQGPETALAVGPDRVIRVFWPERGRGAPGSGGEAEMELWRPLARWFLFDAGLAAGGHGRRLAAAFRSPAPYLLAGGVAAGDVLAAWPPGDPLLAGFDVSSALESSPGVKDPGAIARFFASIGALGAPARPIRPGAA
jgi:phosphoribosylanthranilate isomerase